jgi:ubiquinone/menaquinone biosynthesis C-methylase UbiE
MSTCRDVLAPIYDYLMKPFHWRDKQLAIAEGIAGRILEAGCGTAQLTVNLLDRGLDAYGCDLSAPMVKVGSRNLAVHGHDPARLVVADILRLPFADNSFDYVLLTGVLGLLNLRDQRLALRETYRVCQRGLRLLEPLTINPHRSLRWILLRWIWQIRPVPIEQFHDLQLPYRTGWSTRAGLFSYARVDKR